MFKITNEENYSIEDIHKHQLEGASLLRSAHVGNFNPSTLFLAREEFPIILHEHIRGDAKIYRPAFVKVNGEEILVSDNIEKPLTHLTIRPDAKDRVNNILGKKLTRPSQLHYKSLRELFPRNIQLTSQFFLEQDPFFSHALEVLARVSPRLFANYVNQEGQVFNLSEETTSDHQIYRTENGEEIKIDKEHIGELSYKYLQQTINSILGDSENPEGLVMKSNLYILLSSICETYKGRNGIERYNPEQVSVIHFAGAEMINYLVKNKNLSEYNSKELNEMYGTLQKEFGNILPGNLDFRLVPTDIYGRFVTDDQDVLEEYNELFVAHKELNKAHNERRELRNSLTEKIKQQTLSLGDPDIKEKVLEYYSRIGELPGSIKKGISDAKDMIESIETHRRKILGTLIGTEIAVNNIYSQSPDINNEIEEIRNRISKVTGGLKDIETPIVSQYDILENNVQLYFPELAKGISSRQLRDIWDYSMRESSRDIKKEILPEENNEPSNEYKPKLS